MKDSESVERKEAAEEPQGQGLRVRRLTFTVPPEKAGQKVDTLLRRELRLSGTVIRRAKWLEDGILLDGVRVYTSHKAEEGQVLSIRVSDPELRSGVVPVPGPLNIVYEDADILVINKAPGMLVHPGAGHFSDTVGNYLMDYYRRQKVEADFHPVHRLDKGTSGLMVVAKHPHAQERLKRQLHTPDFRRIYLAVCMGRPSAEAGVIDAPIGRSERSILAREVRPDGQPARTEYRILAAGAWGSLLQLELATGRTHQIRVHMAYLHCPLAGDFLYGSEDGGLISRPALHSWKLELVQPVTGERLHFQIQPPEDMARLLSRREFGGGM